MDFPAVASQLSDLPLTFKRPDATFAQLMDSLAALLTRYTGASDQILAQTTFADAQFGWLDVWGTILNVPRRTNESDVLYRPRIENTLLAWRASPGAIESWLALIELVAGTVTDSASSVGYTIALPLSLTVAQINQIAVDLAYVRPAGVPFQVVTSKGALYLDTVNYFGAPRVTGAYLSGTSSAVAVTISAYTNNAVAQLPDLLMIDPLINAPAVSGAL